VSLDRVIYCEFYSILLFFFFGGGRFSPDTVYSVRDRPHNRQLPNRMSHLTNIVTLLSVCCFVIVIDCIRFFISSSCIFSASVYNCGLRIVLLQKHLIFDLIDFHSIPYETRKPSTAVDAKVSAWRQQCVYEGHWKKSTAKHNVEKVCIFVFVRTCNDAT